MKLASRLMSPAGFGLVLVLFFLLPFLSVSCDVPGSGTTGADYTGADLVGDAKPEWVVPKDVDELLSVPDAPDESSIEDGLAAGVQLLGIALVVLAAGGMAAGLLPTLRARLLGSSVLAAATLAAAIVTLTVALSNLRTDLLPPVREITDGDPTLTPDAVVDELLHVEAGFWLVALVSVMLVLGNVGALLLHRRAQSSDATDSTGGG